MKILILNCGSSSVKCCVYDFKTTPHRLIVPLWKAQLQWKNTFEEPSLTIKNEKGAEHIEVIQEPSSMEQALERLIHFLFSGDTAVLKEAEEIDVIGHRIVHGGKSFKESVCIDSQVKEKIRFLFDLAPLHNPAALRGIEIMERCFKGTIQIAVFDTAFHHALSPAASIYPGPYRWYEEGIQRYGFHGISYQYCSKHSAHLLQSDVQCLKMVICHLGSGASLCAVKDGKSVDTTMGFTPLEGLMMDTRCGSIDPGILLHLLEKKKKSVAELSHELYKESGLLGLSGISSDMRDVIEKIDQGDPRAVLAFDVYVHRLNALIGAMVASLQGLDVLIFTAGIGENASLIRDRVSSAFSFLGANLDRKKNAHYSSEDRILSTEDSKVKILLIHTQESFAIACECWNRIHNKK